MHSARKFIRNSALLTSLFLSGGAFAQGFYGSSEYMDQIPPPPPPSVEEFTHLQPPPPPPPALGNVWQRDGYRRGDIPMPWSGPIVGRYGNPSFSPLQNWQNPSFTAWNNFIDNQSTVNAPMPPSKACVDGSCVGN